MLPSLRGKVIGGATTGLRFQTLAGFPSFFLLSVAFDTEILAPFRLDHDFRRLGGNDKAHAHRRRKIGAARRHAGFWRSFLAFVTIAGGQLVQLAGVNFTSSLGASMPTR